MEKASVWKNSVGDREEAKCLYCLVEKITSTCFEFGYFSYVDRYPCVIEIWPICSLCAEHLRVTKNRISAELKELKDQIDKGTQWFEIQEFRTLLKLGKNDRLNRYLISLSRKSLELLAEKFEIRAESRLKLHEQLLEKEEPEILFQIRRLLIQQVFQEKICVLCLNWSRKSFLICENCSRGLFRPFFS